MRYQNPLLELFCVGDDWQAINGFAGADLKFFQNFGGYFSPSSGLYISTNYRSSQSIVGIGNALMDGLGKPAIAHKTSVGQVLLADLSEFEPSVVEKQRHPGDIITPVVLRLASKALADGLAVVLLCRRNGIPWFVNYQDQGSEGSRGLEHYLDLVRAFFPKGLRERITISTAHKYKGLEKPMVIVLDAVARSYPLIHPDWAFSRILGDSPNKITEEARRLFYVALTHGVEKLVIVTDKANYSAFLDDIQRKVKVPAINWLDFPPVRGPISRVVVKIGNQEAKGFGSTLAIKDSLRAVGYQWQTTGWKGWAKSYPAEGFSIEVLKDEIWAAAADGIDVRVFDDHDAPIACYLVDAGRWHCINNELPKLHGVDS